MQANWSCLPPKGCECSILQPFVVHLNRLWRSDFRISACLDREEHNTPQPEAVYTELSARTTLSIERKSLVWPDNYVELHATDHEFADSVLNRLGKTLRDEPYLLTLPGGIYGRKSWRIALARRIAAEILQHSELIRQGKSVGAQLPVRWRFRRQAADERDPYEPSGGIEIRFDEGDIFRYLGPDTIPRIGYELRGLIERAETKFLSQPDSATILLIACYSAAPVEDEVIREISASYTPAPDIDQIWLDMPSEDVVPEHYYVPLFERTSRLPAAMSHYRT